MQRIPDVRCVEMRENGERILHVKRGEEVILDAGLVNVVLRRGTGKSIKRMDLLVREDGITALEWKD